MQRLLHCEGSRFLDQRQQTPRYRCLFGRWWHHPTHATRLHRQTLPTAKTTAQAKKSFTTRTSMGPAAAYAASDEESWPYRWMGWCTPRAWTVLATATPHAASAADLLSAECAICIDCRDMSARQASGEDHGFSIFTALLEHLWASRDRGNGGNGFMFGSIRSREMQRVGDF